MDLAKNAWEGAWQLCVLNRVHAMGCETVRDFLAKYPAEPYVTIAKRLGEDVAAVQVARLQLLEVKDQEWFRQVAMDSLARELVANLPDGWGKCSAPKPVPPTWRSLVVQPEQLNEEEKRQRMEWQTAGAYSHWVCFLRFHDPEVDRYTEMVWTALKALSPPTGWLPLGADDPFIIQAFDQGWPNAAHRKSKRQSYGLLCPKCTGVLPLPHTEARAIVCYLCGESIELI